MGLWLLCAATERHNDHSRAIPQALAYRIPVYSNDDVAKRYDGVVALQSRKKYRIGGFVVQPLEVKHNVQNYAYVIDTPDNVRVLFVTDAVSFPYKGIKGVNCAMVEANYSDEIRLDNLCRDYVMHSQSQFHMEINETINCIANVLNPCLNAICLIHLSDGQGNETEFKERVHNAFGIMPCAFTNGQVIELTNITSKNAESV